MGNNVNTAQRGQLLSKYDYICQQITPDHHRAKLYRKKTENYDYLILTTTRVHKQIATHILDEVACIAGCRNVMPVLRIHYFCTQDDSINSSTAACNGKWEQHTSLTICQQYANYSLKQHIAFKNKTAQPFTLNQYVYVLKAAVRIALILMGYQFHYLEFDLLPQYLLITVKGELKLLPIRSRSLQVIGQQCDCWNQMQMQQCSGSGEQRQAIRLKRGVRSRRYIRQIKQLGCSMMSEQIKCLHDQVLKVGNLEQLNLLLLPLQDEFFVFNYNRNSTENMPSDVREQERSISKVGQHNKEKIRFRENRSKLQLNLNDRQGAVEWSQPTLASPYHAATSANRNKL